MATAFKIESDIPAPPETRGGRRYPFNEMKPGDSVLIPSDASPENSVRRAAAQYAKRNGLLFTCRRWDGGVRVWRLA